MEVKLQSQEATQPEVLFTVEDNIGILTLNRPEKMNAFSDAMRAQYLDLLNQITYDRNVRTTPHSLLLVQVKVFALVVILMV